MSENLSAERTDPEGRRPPLIAASVGETARETFHRAAELIATHLGPEDRAVATATTFWQIGDLAGDLPLTLVDLAAGLELLVSPRVFAESPATTARRNTYDEIAALILRVSIGDPQRLAAVFRVVATRCERSPDPKHAQLGAIAAREATELETV